MIKPTTKTLRFPGYAAGIEPRALRIRRYRSAYHSKCLSWKSRSEKSLNISSTFNVVFKILLAKSILKSSSINSSYFKLWHIFGSHSASRSYGI